MLKIIYKNKIQEARRKGLLKMLIAKARAQGLSIDELRSAIMAEARRKPRPGLVLKNFNFKIVDGERVVSLSSLKIWQLRQCDMAIFPKDPPSLKLQRIKEDKSGVRPGKTGNKPDVSDPDLISNVIEFEEWHKGEKDGR